jgi:hypothetical protein
MYNNLTAPVAAGVAGGGTLAMTGGSLDVLWAVLAAFAMLALGLALVRIAPRLNKDEE